MFKTVNKPGEYWIKIISKSWFKEKIWEIYGEFESTLQENPWKFHSILFTFIINWSNRIPQKREQQWIINYETL